MAQNGQPEYKIDGGGSDGGATLLRGRPHHRSGGRWRALVLFRAVPVLPRAASRRRLGR